MSPELRGIKASDAIKASETTGGVRKPGKGEVKVGRLKDAIHEAGLTVEEFFKLPK